jgi:DnaJ-class molecular chaperone
VPAQPRHPRQADIRDIKKAYKKMAITYHPDKAPLAEKAAYEDKFKEVGPVVLGGVV